MDYNSYLSKYLWMHFGYYDTKTLKINRNYLLLNKISVAISLICFLKLIIIILSEDRLRFYLIGFYLFEGKAEKIFDLGFIFIHIGTAYSYYYWSSMLVNDKSFKLLKHLNFLFIPNLDELIAYYNLDRESTKKFLKKAELYRYLMKFMIVPFELFFELLTIRCCYFAFLNLENYYVYTIGLFFMVVSLFSFHLISSATLKLYLIIFISIEFLILQMAQIERKLLNEFDGTKKCFIFKKGNTKQQASTLSVFKHLDAFAKQAIKIIEIFDNLISLLLLGSLINCYCFAYLIIFSTDIPFVLKILIFLLYVLCLVGVCSSIAFYNDHFKKKVIL